MKYIAIAALFVFSTSAYGQSETQLDACNKLGKFSEKNAVCVQVAKTFPKLTAAQIHACDKETEFMDSFGSCLMDVAGDNIKVATITKCGNDTEKSQSFFSCLNGGSGLL